MDEALLKSLTDALTQVLTDEAQLQAAITAVQGVVVPAPASDQNVETLKSAAVAYAVSQGYTAPEAESAAEDSAEGQEEQAAPANPAAGVQSTSDLQA